MGARKRRRIETTDEDLSRESFSQPEVSSARRSISPPSHKRDRSSQVIANSMKCDLLPISGPSPAPLDGFTPQQETHISTLSSSTVHETSSASITTSSSPVQLISIKDMPSSYNIDTISLRDILGEPLIQECWIFNYLFDVDFVMEQFDEDTRDLVKIKIIHGSWKTEDTNRKRINEAANRYSNVQPIAAYMPEAYGTHHSKMIVLFRHDELAQVIIMTANMVAGDWRMCQAVWRSPLLPMRAAPVPLGSGAPRIGSGARFKRDLLAYLRKYETRTKDLVARLLEYDFGSVRAALIASTPSKVNVRNCDLENDVLWGWPALKRIVGGIPTTSAEPHIVIQVSSIASVGEKWVSTTFFEALSATATSTHSKKPKPIFSIVFPTGDEIRRSIDGYSAGSSIHLKTQSAAQLKQLTYLKPMLCHWAGDLETQSGSLTPLAIREAGRRRTAPHIKTYVRFRDQPMTKIDWAMMTSANLSTQAWGGATNAAGEVRVCSYEIGIVVWPELWDEGKAGSAEMVPVFKSDTPPTEESSVEMVPVFESDTPPTKQSSTVNDKPRTEIKTRVGWRMPYDLPLVPYQKEEMPWCATAPCNEPDWMGRIWPGFGN